MELVFPERSLILMCAAPGCGKSTFANRHFLSTQVVSSDRCREMVSDDVEDMSVHRETFSLVRHICHLRLSLGKLTVIDSTSLNRSSRASFQKLASQHGFASAVILLDLPLNVCLERNEQRQRQVPPEVIRRFHAYLQDTKRTIWEERFDQVYVVSEEELNNVRVTIKRKHKRPVME